MSMTSTAISTGKTVKTFILLGNRGEIMEVLKLRKELFPLVLSGKKTSTSRQGIRLFEVGEEIELIMTEDETCSIDVTVTNVKHIKYKDLTEVEAIKEGYSSLEELQFALEKIYTVNDDDDFTIIEFTMRDIFPSDLQPDPSASEFRYW